MSEAKMSKYIFDYLKLIALGNLRHYITDSV